MLSNKAFRFSKGQCILQAGSPHGPGSFHRCKFFALVGFPFCLLVEGSHHGNKLGQALPVKQKADVPLSSRSLQFNQVYSR